MSCFLQFLCISCSRVSKKNHRRMTWQIRNRKIYWKKSRFCRQRMKCWKQMWPGYVLCEHWKMVSTDQVDTYHFLCDSFIISHWLSAVFEMNITFSYEYCRARLTVNDSVLQFWILFVKIIILLVHVTWQEILCSRSTYHDANVSNDTWKFESN